MDSSARSFLRALGGALLLVLAHPARAAQVLRPAPPLEARDDQNRPFSLAALRGHVVLLDFWASWCAPCRKSLPFADGLQDRYGPRGLRVVGVSLDQDDGARSDFLLDHPVRFTVVPDEAGRTAEAFGVVAMPTAFLIDQEGRIVARFEGGGSGSGIRIPRA